MALDMKAAVEIESRESIKPEPRESQINDLLSKGLLQFIIKNHPELVIDFLKENGMDNFSLVTSQIPGKGKAAVTLV